MPDSFSARLLRIAVYSVLAALLLALMMGAVTYRLCGAAGLAAMGAALIIGLISNVAGAAPACASLGIPGPASAKHLLGGMALRLIVLAILAVPTLAAAVLPVRPLLLWLAGGYFVLLMLETSLVAYWLNQHSQGGK